MCSYPPEVPIEVRRQELLIWHLPFERLITFDRQGQELFRRDGGFDQVHLAEHDRDALQTNEVIVIHNHPLDRSFSIRDVNMACVHNLAILRAISPSFLHTLTSPEGGWDSGVCQRELFPRGHVLEAAVEAEQQAAIDHGDLTIEQAERDHKHTIWTRLALEFGFGYWRERLPLPVG